MYRSFYQSWHRTRHWLVTQSGQVGSWAKFWFPAIVLRRGRGSEPRIGHPVSPELPRLPKFQGYRAAL